MNAKGTNGVSIRFDDAPFAACGSSVFPLCINVFRELDGNEKYNWSDHLICSIFVPMERIQS